MSLGFNSGTYYDEEKDNMKNILIAYHENCIDGFTSAWVTHRGLEKLGYKCAILPMGYNTTSEMKLIDALNKDLTHELYVVDFSLKRQFLDLIEGNHKHLIITTLDHHKTAFEIYASGIEITPVSKYSATIGRITIILDNAESGASLCWKYFNGGLRGGLVVRQLPALVRYVKDYDLWQYKYGDEARYINKFLKEQEMTLANWDDISHAMEATGRLGEILEEGKALQRKHNQAVDLVVAGAKRVVIQGYTGLVVECPHELTSDVGHALAEEIGTFGLMYQIDFEANIIKWSLRSVKNFDVSTMAKKFGGGGHKNAAGFETALFPDVPIGVVKEAELY